MTIVAGIIFGFISTSLAGVCSGTGAMEGPAAGRPMGTADGLYWEDDHRLTMNQTDDCNPTLAVDSSGFSHVMWYRAGMRMYEKIGPEGRPAIQERAIVSVPMTVQHSGQPTESMAIDSGQDLHVVWCAQGIIGPLYQKYSSNGFPLCQPMNLAPMASSPHTVALAISKSARAYTAYENQAGLRVEMAYVDSCFNLHTGYLARYSGTGVAIGLDKRDNPYVFSKGWAGTGLWVTKFNPEGLLVQAPTPVGSPVSGTGWSSPMPKVAFTTDGAIHLLQASRTSGSRWLYYTKLSDNGTRLTNDIPLTQCSADFGDICADSKNNIFIIWGDTNAGELYYVRIAPNRENESFMPVKLTQAPGGDNNPRISVDPDDRLHVAWVSERDGNREIYYKFAFGSGVELYMSPGENAGMEDIHPNQTKMANITVRNIGGQNDRIWMGINAEFYEKPGGIGKDYKGSGWNVWLDERYSIMDMEAREVRTVSFWVRGPSEGQPGEYIDVLVNATSKMNPTINSTVEIRIFLVVDHRILLQCHDHLHTTYAGVPTQFIVGVADIGDTKERINLTSIGPPGWEYRLDHFEVSLKVGESINVTLTVMPPAGAPDGETGIVTVTGRSIAQWSVNDQAVTSTVIAQLMDVSMTSDPPEGSVVPGGMARFELTVSNSAHQAAMFWLLLETVNGTGDWMAYLDNNTVWAGGGYLGLAVLSVVAPSDALTGSRLVVRVKVFNTEGNAIADCRVDAMVDQVHKIEMACNPKMVSLPPDGTTGIHLTVSNLGNGVEVLTPDAFGLPAGWCIEYDRRDWPGINAPESLSLEPGRALTFDATIFTTSSVPAGRHDIKGRFSGRDGNIYSVEISVLIDQVYDIDIRPEVPRQTGEPGRTVFFTVMADNRGNGFDILSFNTSGLPGDWPAPELRDINGNKNDRMALNESSTGTLTLEMTLPRMAKGTAVEFLLTARSRGGVTDSTGLVIDIKKANLVMTRLSHTPKTLQDGDVANFTAEVRNPGDLDADNVLVRIYHDDTVLGTERLGMMQRGSSRMVTFSWVVSGGQHTLKVMVDPDDLIVEANENDNIAKESLDVQRPGAGGQPAFMIPLLAVVAVALLAAVAILVRRRRKRRVPAVVG